MALACDFWVRILDRRHHAHDPGGDHGIGARRRLADMRTRFQRHIERGAARGLAGAVERLGLGVGAATGLGPATADNDAILDHDRADGGIGPGAALPAPAERQCQLHEALIGGLRFPRFLRELESGGEAEVSSEAIGEIVMEHLRQLDDVAYVRFASVYRNFREAKDFEAVLGELSGDDDARIALLRK